MNREILSGCDANANRLIIDSLWQYADDPE